MFTGIVQGIATVAQATDRPGLRSFRLRFPPGFADGLAIGARRHGLRDVRRRRAVGARRLATRWRDRSGDGRRRRSRLRRALALAPAAVARFALATTTTAAAFAALAAAALAATL